MTKRKPRIIHNCRCDKCSKVEVQMVGIGILIFCNDCYAVEFKTDDPVKKESENYLKWVKKRNDQVMKELEEEEDEEK